MRPRRPAALPALGIVLLAASLTGAHCHSNSTPGAPPPPPPPAATDSGAPPPNEGLTEAETQKLLPGIDTASLTPKQRSDLVDLAGDTICPCAATTVSGCLRQGPSCPAAHRLLELAKRMLVAGQPEVQALLRIETYYGSFPDDRRKEVGTDGPSRGPDSARVVLVEFSDFQCPACRAAEPGLDELMQKYPNDVRWVFRNFPLPMHQFAEPAAAGGVYAAQHGKFWPLADYFFGHQDQIFEQGPDHVEEGFRSAAKAAGLDPDAFIAATTNPDMKAKVDADKQEGEQLQLTGTPSIFLNGRPLTALPPSAEYLSWTVEDELEWQSNGKKWTTQ